MPDLAVLRVVVDGDGAGREQAYEAAAPLAAAVDEVFGQHAAAIGRTTTAALTVQPRTRWRKGEVVRAGWRAQRMSVVEVRALEQVGELAANLVGAGASLSGPSWELDRANPAYRDARQEAAVDARQRAADYAAAIGVGLGPVLWVSEPGLRLGGGPVRAFAAMRAAASGVADEPTEPIEITPEEITIQAAVEVGFAIA